MIVLVALSRQKVGIALRALAGYFSYINKAVFISKKHNIFFPSCGKDDFINYSTCYRQCYGHLYFDTLFLTSFFEVFSAENTYCMSEKS